MTCLLIIPAAGSGARLGASVPKAFVQLAGKTLLGHALERALAVDGIDAIVIAAPTGHQEQTNEVIAAATAASPGARAKVSVVEGGAERTDSVAVALRAAPHADVVLVHDAARCLTPPAVFEAVIDAISAGAAAAVPALPVVDTIKTVGPQGPGGGRVLRGNLRRDTLRRVQTPQGFRHDVLQTAHAVPGDAYSGALATDDALLAEMAGFGVEEVVGDELALKITYPFDLVIAQSLLQNEE